jgi:hypothetical protein
MCPACGRILIDDITLVGEMAGPIRFSGRHWPSAAFPPVFRDDVKPLEIVQPAGPSFATEGNEVRWQKCRFRVGFNAAWSFGDVCKPLMDDHKSPSMMACSGIAGWNLGDSFGPAECVTVKTLPMREPRKFLNDFKTRFRQRQSVRQTTARCLIRFHRGHKREFLEIADLKSSVEV